MYFFFFSSKSGDSVSNYASVGIYFFKVLFLFSFLTAVAYTIACVEIKKTVLYFVFLVVLESRFQLFLSKLECRAFDIDFCAIQKTQEYGLRSDKFPEGTSLSKLSPGYYSIY